VSEFNDVLNVGFYTDNNNRPKDRQSLKETQEYMWMFAGMTGFRNNRKKR
jgi:hypothetical protein